MQAKEHSDDPPEKIGNNAGFTSRPVPDPTVLTTDQLLRAIAGLREVIEARLDGMDKAIELLQRTSDQFPLRIDEKIKALGDVHDEKFSSIEKQFKERDVRTEQTLKDGKVSIDAALLAQKESASKSEVSMSKQLDQLGTLIGSNNKALDDKHADLKERLTRIEGIFQGTSTTASDTRLQHNWSTGMILTSTLAALALLAGIASVIVVALKH